MQDAGWGPNSVGLFTKPNGLQEIGQEKNNFRCLLDTGKSFGNYGKTCRLPRTTIPARAKAIAFRTDGPYAQQGEKHRPHAWRDTLQQLRLLTFAHVNLVKGEQADVGFLVLFPENGIQIDMKNLRSGTVGNVSANHVNIIV